MSGSRVKKYRSDFIINLFIFMVSTAIFVFLYTGHKLPFSNLSYTSIMLVILATLHTERFPLPTKYYSGVSGAIIDIGVSIGYAVLLYIVLKSLYARLVLFFYSSNTAPLIQTLLGVASGLIVGIPLINVLIMINAIVKVATEEVV